MQIYLLTLPDLIKYPADYIAPQYTCNREYQCYYYILMQLNRYSHNRVNDQLNNETDQ